MQQFMLFYSFLWCLLKISKLCHTDFFSLCISLRADTVWIKSLTKREGSEPACLLKLLETFLIFQEATEDAGASVVHRFNIQSYLGRRLVWFCSNVSSFAILFSSYQAWKWLEIQKRVCVSHGCVKPEGVCPPSTPWGKDGWPCIIFLQLYLHRWEITVSSWYSRHNDIRVWGHL